MTARILAGLAAGVVIGLFLGEHATVLQGLADIYIRLLQMTVLPYLVVSVVLGVGRLEPGQGRQLLRYGGAGVLAIWAISLMVVACMPLAFPSMESASFFSTAMVEPRAPLGLTDLYIPANPFHALANSLVPAVTLFSAAVGTALMGVPSKARLLGPLETAMQAIERVMSFVVRLTPIGVVPIVAVAAGTLSLQQVQRLEAYVLAFVVAALLLGLVLLPLLVSAVTPFRYGEIVWASRDVLLTAFLTSSVFVVLPLLVERSRELSRRAGLADAETDGVPAVLVPLAFNLPTAGKLLTLLFVPFSAWLSGEALELAAYPRLLGAGLASYFAKAQVALPFLLDVAGVPHDYFQLYIPSAVVTGKFDSAVGAMSLLATALLAMATVAGRLKLGTAAALRTSVTLLALLLGATAGTRWLLGAVVDTRYGRAEALRQMHLSRSTPPAVVAGEPTQVAAPGSLARIRSRGSLRAGFLPGRMPFAFTNASGEVVGFDVELLTQLTADLGVKLEMVPVSLDGAESALARGLVDVVPSIPHTHHWLGRVRLSMPYAQGTIGLLVPDGQRRAFDTMERLRAHDTLRIGLVADRDLYENYVRHLVGPTPYRLVALPADPDAVLGQGLPGVDAVMMLAEVGTAWALLHPEFTLVVPQPDVIRRPLAFAMALDADDLQALIDAWLRLQEARGALASAYDYWILGRGAAPAARRWSVGHDVLGWF